MKKSLPNSIERHRIKTGVYGSDSSYGLNGVFIIPFDEKTQLQIMVSDQCGWDHVSVTIYDRKETPSWDHMCFVKDIFFDDNETAIQYHPSKKAKININENVLHIWRPHNYVIKMPPTVFV